MVSIIFELEVFLYCFKLFKVVFSLFDVNGDWYMCVVLVNVVGWYER